MERIRDAWRLLVTGRENPAKQLPTATTQADESTSSDKQAFVVKTGKKSQYTNDTDVRAIAREELAQEAKELRKDFIAIFGLFAAFLTFTVLQIQALVQSKKMSLILGAAAFFVASSLTFVLSLHNMIHEKNSWKEFFRPIFFLILIIFYFSFECFWYATHNGEFYLL